MSLFKISFSGGKKQKQTNKKTTESKGITFTVSDVKH